MVTVEFATEKLSEEQLTILPTIVVEKNDGTILILFVWIKGMFAIGLKKDSKKKLKW